MWFAAFIAAATVAIAAIAAFVLVFRRESKRDDLLVDANRKVAEYHTRLVAAENSAGLWRAACERVTTERDGERASRSALAQENQRLARLLAEAAPGAVLPEVSAELKHLADLGKPK